jgi:hypothetical protein
MKRHLLVLGTCIAFAAAAITPVAGADPTNAKNAAQIHAICGGQPVNVVVNGNGTFSPAHVIGSTSVFIPTAFDLTFTFTPAGGGAPSVDTETSSKAAPIKNTTSCTIPLQTVFSGPEGTGTLQGTVTGFFTPR